MSARAEIVTKRTYCREKEDGSLETWEEVVERVMSHQKWLWERALTHLVLPDIPLKDLSSNMMEWVHLNRKQEQELEELKELFLHKKALPSGRALWISGTDVSRTRESSNFNCAYLNVETVYDIVDAFWLLLQGAGIGFTAVPGTLSGFRKPIKEIKVIRSKKSKYEKGKPDNEEDFTNGVWTIKVGDSAEAWAKSIGKLLAGKYDAHTLIFDFSEIRGKGQRLRGYGWISSGDDQISIAYPKIANILNNKAGWILSKIDILDVMNLLGTVLSSRRSAEIALTEYKSSEWLDFVEAKRKCYTPEFSHRQQSNNSIIFNTKPTKEELEELFNMIDANGGSEPGFINMESAKKRAPWVQGVNPCGEVLLSNKSFCCLSEINLEAFIGNPAALHRAGTLIGRANYRQTVVDFRDGILQESWHLNNEFLHLCGVGITGIVTHDNITEYELKDLRYSAVEGSRSMAKELRLPHPKNTTTVKPSGSLSKIMDTTEGCHKPYGKYIFNWINFATTDPLVDVLIEAGYDAIENPSDKTSTLVCFPVTYSNVKFDKVTVMRKDGTLETLEVNNESAIEQLERYKKLMTWYCDHNVSITVAYSKDEIPSIIEWLLNNWSVYVGVSFLPRIDATTSANDLGYLYLPQEVVSQQKYDEYVSRLSEVKLKALEIDDDFALQDCVNGVCPVK